MSLKVLEDTVKLGFTTEQSGALVWFHPGSLQRAMTAASLSLQNQAPTEHHFMHRSASYLQPSSVSCGIFNEGNVDERLQCVHRNLGWTIKHDQQLSHVTFNVNCTSDRATCAEHRTRGDILTLSV